MTDKYDCTDDVLQHRKLVAFWINDVIKMLDGRAKSHDESKLSNPIEKALFDKWTPDLRERTFGSDSYKQALDSMGEGVKLHYENNRHHPEHFENGIDGMTLYDLIEMFCDWLAAAERRGVPLDIDHARERFGINEQLFNIMLNTIKDIDFWFETNNCSPGFTPDKYHK